VSTPCGAGRDPASGLRAVVAALEETGATGFVHVSGDDADRRFLTRTSRPQRDTAVVVVRADGDYEAIYCLPDPSHAAATVFLNTTGVDEHLHRSVAFRSPGTTVGSHVGSVLSDRCGAEHDRELLAPRRLPHDAALELTTAGYTLSSTTALADARATKSPAEHDRMAAVQRAVATALTDGVALLAESDVVDGAVRYAGEALPGSRLETEIRVALARSDVVADRVAVQAWSNDDTTDGAESDALPAGEPIEMHVQGRGPAGYSGRLTRTFVVDSDGGWDRRAFIACEAGLRAGLRHCKPESSVRAVRGEAVAEITAYGFSPAASPPATAAADSNAEATPPRHPPGASARVFGIGLDPHEAPSVDDGGRLTAGSVLALETSVFDPSYGRIRLGTVATVTRKTDQQESAENGEELVSYPFALTPQATRAAAPAGITEPTATDGDDY